MDDMPLISSKLSIGILVSLIIHLGLQTFHIYC